MKKLIQRLLSDIYPKAIYLMPTMNCNLDCSMCYLKKYSDTTREFKPEDYKKLVKEINGWWIKPYFYFLGGEPLTYRYFSEVLSILKPYEIIINTNGLLLPKFAETIIKNNVKTLIVSVDGLENDMIRNRNGLYKAAVEGIRKINRLKKDNPLININTVILPENCMNLYAFLEDINNVGIDILTLGHRRFMTPHQKSKQINYVKSNFRNQNFFPIFGIHDIEKISVDKNILHEQIMKIENNKHRFNFKINYIHDLNKMIRYYDDNFLNPYQKCFSIFNAATINPYGDVLLCDCYKIGNIKENRLGAIWKSKKARLLRKKHIETKGFPSCRYC